MDNRPIGIFDSGVGGLTAVKAVYEIMPHENIVYFGDTARAPYGNLSPQTICDYAGQDINFLQSKNVKAIVAACGTVSSYICTKDFSLPVFEVISPASSTALNLTQSGKIAVLGTHATIAGESYKKRIQSANPSVQVFQQACPELVKFIESGMFRNDSVALEKVLKLYIEPLLGKGIDTVIMGCTHYPLIENLIKKTFEGAVNFISPGFESAKMLNSFLTENNLNSSRNKCGKTDFFVSGDCNLFEDIANTWLSKSTKNSISRADAYADNHCKQAGV